MNAAPRLTLCLLRQGFGAAWKFPLNGFAALLNLFQKLAQSRLCGLVTLEIGNPSLSDDELVVCFARPCLTTFERCSTSEPGTNSPCGADP